jgi:hypothetical protein
MVVFLFNTVIYVFLFLRLCILIVCLCIFIVPAGTLRLPWLRYFRAFSSVVRQMPGYNSQRRGTAPTLSKLFVLFYVLFVLCRSAYCLCVNVYCTTATGWQPNCVLTNMLWMYQKDFGWDAVFRYTSVSMTHRQLCARSGEIWPKKCIIEVVILELMLKTALTNNNPANLGHTCTSVFLCTVIEAYFCA